MQDIPEKLLTGYQAFREKYAAGDSSIMQTLAEQGQKPEIMVVACSDSRVDPAVILQCDPGDLFVVRNVASLVPPYEQQGRYHSTSAALEFAVKFLKVKHLIILGHSHCGGIQALLELPQLSTEFIAPWVSLVTVEDKAWQVDECVKHSLGQSQKNCLTFPWIQEAVSASELKIHLWFFDIKHGQVFTHSATDQSYQPL